MYFYNKHEYELYNEDHRKLSESLDLLFEKYIEKDIYGFINFYNECMFIDENYDSIISEGKLRQIADKTKVANKKVDDKVDSSFQPIINSVKRSIIGQTREEIIQNNVKVSKIIRRCLVTGGLWMINPAIALLKIFITKALRQKLKTEEREKILADLKRELAICEEKIRDADSSGDKSKKYELMRLKNELERSIQRVRSPHLINS